MLLIKKQKAKAEQERLEGKYDENNDDDIDPDEPDDDTDYIHTTGMVIKK